MTQLWAMQRANGDWFALDDREGYRVPFFQSSRDATQARAFNVDMLVFHPVKVDEPALRDLCKTNGTGPVHFWLVDREAVNLKRGHRIEQGQLAGLALGRNDGEIDLVLP